MKLEQKHNEAQNKRKLPHEANVLICGLARNSENEVDEAISRLLNATRIFASTKVLVIESDSEDSTPEKLSKLAANEGRMKLLCLGKLRMLYPLRTQRIAFCRNKYLHELNTKPEYRDIDYVIVADLDGVNNLISAEAVLSCWDTNTDWDVITANQLDRYYDIWALRHQFWCPYDCWRAKKWFETISTPFEALKIAVSQKQIRIPRKAGLIEVDSAFGGLAVYKKSALRDCRYIGVDEENEEICEHVTLHKQLKSAGYRIYINSRLINGKRIEHIQPRTTVGWIMKKLQGLLFKNIKTLGRRLMHLSCWRNSI